MSLLDELIYGIKDVYVDGVLQPRRAAIDLVGGVVRDNPARRLLEVDLGGSGGGGSGSGGGASLDRTLLVCPLTGDDATGGRGSPFETIQAALNAAAAGDTVLVSPGEYDLGASGLTWPAVTGVTLMGMPGPGGRSPAMPITGLVPVSVILTNEGTVPVISGSLAAGVTAAVVCCAVVPRGTAVVPAVRLTGVAGSLFGMRETLALAPGATALRAVALDTDGVDRVVFDRVYGVAGASIREARSVWADGSASVYLDKVAGEGGVTGSAGKSCSVHFQRSTGELDTVGNVDVYADEWTTLDRLSVDAGAFGVNVTVRGTVEELALTLDAGHSNDIDLCGATVVEARITVPASTERVRIDARGCRTRPTPWSSWELDGPIDCDLTEAPRAVVYADGGACVNRDVTAEFWETATQPSGGEFDVAIDPPFIGSEYRVDIETDYEVTTWVTDKTSSGFKVHYGAGVGGQISGAARLLGRL